MASRGYQSVVGIDTSQHAVAMAKMRLKDERIRNVEILNIDATNMQRLEDGNFEVAIDSCCLHCIIELEERKNFFSSVFRVLKKNGSLLGRSMCQPYTEIRNPHYREHFRIDGKVVLRRLPESSDFVPCRIVRSMEEIKDELSAAGLELSWSVHELIIPGPGGCHHLTYHAKKP